MPFERGHSEVEIHESVGEVAVGSIRGAGNPVLLLADELADRLRALHLAASAALKHLSGPARAQENLAQLLQALRLPLETYAAVRNVYYGGIGPETEIRDAQRELDQAMARLQALRSAFED